MLLAHAFLVPAQFGWCTLFCTVVTLLLPMLYISCNLSLYLSVSKFDLLFSSGSGDERENNAPPFPRSGFPGSLASTLPRSGFGSLVSTVSIERMPNLDGLVGRLAGWLADWLAGELTG